MKTLDRYIIRNFLFAVGLCFVVFMLLRILADLCINLDEFAEKDRPFRELVRMIVTYYGFQALTYFAEMGGIIIVIGAAFALAMMNHTNELVAILASGVSLRRVVWPIILCSAIISVTIVADRELAIPPVKHRLVRGHEDVFGQDRLPVRLMLDGTGAVWHAEAFRPRDQATGLPVMDFPVVVLRNKELAHVGEIHGIEAAPATLDGRAGWRFERAALSGGGTESEPWPENPRYNRIHTRADPKHILTIADPNHRLMRPHRAGTARPSVKGVDVWDATYGLRIQAERFWPDPYDPRKPWTGALEQPRFTYSAPGGQILGIFHAARAIWRPGQAAARGHWELIGGKLFYPTDLTTEDLLLRQSRRWMDYMSTSELTRLLRLDRVLDRPGAILARHVRFTEPINNLVMLLLALPFILSRERNIKASATFCLLTVGTFYAFIYLCRQMGLPPTLGAWLPILLFGPIAVVMFDSVKT